MIGRQPRDCGRPPAARRRLHRRVRLRCCAWALGWNASRRDHAVCEIAALRQYGISASRIDNSVQIRHLEGLDGPSSDAGVRAKHFGNPDPNWPGSQLLAPDSWKSDRGSRTVGLVTSQLARLKVDFLSPPPPYQKKKKAKKRRKTTKKRYPYRPDQLEASANPYLGSFSHSSGYTITNKYYLIPLCNLAVQRITST